MALKKSSKALICWNRKHRYLDLPIYYQFNLIDNNVNCTIRASVLPWNRANGDL